MSATYNSPLKINDPDKPAVQLIINNPTTLSTAEIDDHHEKPPDAVQGFTGIDDGFFDERSRSSTGDDKFTDTKYKDESTVPEFEVEIPSTVDIVEVPSISVRFGEDEEIPNTTDATDGGKDDEDKAIKINRNLLSPPHYGMDFEAGSVVGADGSIPDVNIYQHKKTLAQGMMDLALFSANANQLRYVLESNKHPYYYPSVILISFSLVLQVAVGIGLIWNATYNVKDEKEICIANKINNFTVIGIFLVTVINVFISAFGVGSTQ